MSENPIAFACTRPRSTSLSLTQRSRSRSVMRATAGVPAGPMRERAWRRSLFNISGRRDSSSTGARRFVRTSASCRQFSPGSCGASSRTRPRSIPPTYAVEMCTRCGFAPLAFSASTRRAAPSKLVWADRSAGLSNSTAAAEWMTTSHPRSADLDSSLRPSPSRPRSISITPSFSRVSLAKPSSPSASFRRLKAGLARTSRSSRSLAGLRALERMARLIRLMSGIERRHFSTIDLPRKPVLPVTRMVLPFRASAITRTILVRRGSVTQVRNVHDRRTAAVPPAEVRGHGRPEPDTLASFRDVRRVAVAPRAGPAPLHAVRRDGVDEKVGPGSGARPGDVDHRGVVELRDSAHRDVRHRDVGEARRAADPQVADVLGPGVGIRAAPAVWVHRTPAADAVHAEMQVRAGGGPGHAGDADDLAAVDVLALGDPDMGHVPVKSHQAVAVVDLDRLSAEARL